MKISKDNFIKKAETLGWEVVCYQEGSTFNVDADGRKCEVDVKKGLFKFTGTSWVKPIALVSDKSYIPIDGFLPEKEKVDFKKKFVVYVDDCSLEYIKVLAWYASWKLATTYGRKNVITKLMTYSEVNVKDGKDVPMDKHAKDSEIIYIGTSGNWKYTTQYSDSKTLDKVHKLGFARAVKSAASSVIKGLTKFDIYPNGSIEDEVKRLENISLGGSDSGYTVDRFIYGLCRVRSLSYLVENRGDILDVYFNRDCPELLIDITKYKSLVKEASKHEVTPELMEVVNEITKVSSKHVVLSIENRKDDYCRYWHNYALYPALNLAKKLHEGKFIICVGVNRVDVYYTCSKSKELAGVLANLSLAIKAEGIKSTDTVQLYIEEKKDKE